MNSKAKGSRFERAIGKWLTEWTGFKFERNRAGSGSWHTNNDSVSDITCTDERHAHRCKISIECKSYKDIKLEHVLLGNKGCDIERFWSQAKGDALRAKRKPILIMRYNSMPKNEFFMVVDSDLAEAFQLIVFIGSLISYSLICLKANGSGLIRLFLSTRPKNLE